MKLNCVKEDEPGGEFLFISAARRREAHNFAIVGSTARPRNLPMQPSDRWFVAVLRHICGLRDASLEPIGTGTTDKIARIGTGTRGGDDETLCGFSADL